MTYDDIYLKYNLIHALPISDCNTKSRFGYIESLKYKPSTYDKIFISVLKEVIQEIL